MSLGKLPAVCKALTKVPIQSQIYLVEKDLRRRYRQCIEIQVRLQAGNENGRHSNYEQLYSTLAKRIISKEDYFSLMVSGALLWW